MIRSVVIILLFIFYTNSYGQSNRGRFETLETKITQSVEKALDSLFYVPGLQVAVVQGDEFFYSRGFGIADASNEMAVSSKTGFYIASTTKSFIGMLAAILANEHSLDAPLTHYFPGLQFEAAGLDAERISLRDHLTHRHGYESDELAFLPPTIGNLSKERIVELVSEFAKASPITFDYSNESYIMAAAAMEMQTGRNWKELLVQHIFHPLGMKNTTPYMSEATQRPFAYPHNFRDGAFIRNLPKADTNMHAAGGLVSTATDLGRWLRTVMNEGMLDGEQRLSKLSVEEALAPQVSLEKSFYGGIERYAYGFGWYHAMLEGDVLMHHFGGFTGYHCHMSYMPQHQTGVVVLANTGTIAPQDIAKRIYHLMFDNADDTAYAQKLHELVASRRQEVSEDEQAWLAKRTINDSDRPAHEYCGEYESSRLGTIKITLEGDQLVAKLGPKRSELIPFQEDVLLVNWHNQKKSMDLATEKPDKLFFTNNYEHDIIALRWESPWFGEIGVLNKDKSE